MTMPTHTLPIIYVTAATAAGDELFVEDAHGNAERIAENERGGWSRHVGPHAFGNYPSMADAARASAREGYHPRAVE